METKISSLATSYDMTQDRQPLTLPQTGTGSLASQIATGAVDAADLRLVIESDGNSYVYKTVNRVTGEIIARYPRDDVVKMQDEAAYEAGQIIRAKA